MDIKHCPFCGESTGLVFEDGSTYRWGIASCKSCGANAGETRREYPDNGEWHKDAIEQWNERNDKAQSGYIERLERDITTIHNSGDCGENLKSVVEFIASKPKDIV